MDTPKPSQSDQSNRTLSVGTWSGFAGANQSKVVDLLIGNGLNVCLVIAIVLLFTADGLVLGLVGALFAVVSLLIIGWLMRREVGRRRGLLGLNQAPRLLLMIAVAGGYLLRRPQDSVWVWIATGLAVLAILSESTLRTLLGRTRSMATNLPGVPVVTKPPVQSQPGRGGTAGRGAARRDSGRASVRRVGATCWSSWPASCQR